MGTVEGIEKVLAVLAPHWNEIEAEFQRQDIVYRQLAAVDHDAIGRVLRSHLVIENYMSSFLAHFYKQPAFDDARLSFYQKAILLPQRGSSASFVRDGIIELNALRNKFAHRLTQQAAQGDVETILRMLQISGRKTENISPIDAIEIFTPVACTFLSISPERIQGLFADAFRDVQLPLD